MRRTTQMKRGTSVPDEEEWIEKDGFLEGIMEGTSQMIRESHPMTRGTQPMVRLTRAPGAAVFTFPPSGYLLKPDNCDKEEIIYRYHGRKHSVIDLSICEHYCKMTCSAYVKHCVDREIRKNHIRYTAFQ